MLQPEPPLWAPEQTLSGAESVTNFQPALPFPPRRAAALVDDLGGLVLRAWLHGATPDFPVMTPGQILATASSGAATSLREEIALVASQLAALDEITTASAGRLTTEIARFIATLDAHDITSLRDVTPEHAVRFVDECVAKGNGFSDPKPGTQRLRRSAIRLLFRTARGLHLVAHDPTLDLVLPAGTVSTVRPLEDAEEIECRIASRHSLTATRLPAAWALGQATATASEIADACVGDLDLANRRVWLSGTTRRTPRWGRLTDWGISQLAVRVDHLDRDPSSTLVYNGRRGAVTDGTGWCSALHDVLALAGLAREPGIAPASLPAWAGRHAFEETGRINDAAKVLGLHSLDRTAAVIGWDWS